MKKLVNKEKCCGFEVLRADQETNAALGWDPDADTDGGWRKNDVTGRITVQNNSELSG